MSPRPTPFALAFEPLAEERFPVVRQSLEAGQLDPHDRDAFVLDRQVASLLRELVPQEGVGEAIEQHLALLHHAYLFWSEGKWLFRLSRRRVEALLAPEADPAGHQDANAPRAYYIQFPQRLVWAETTPEPPHEPLDGMFVRPWTESGFFVLGIFGLHPARAGFSVVEAEGYRSETLKRADGSPLFSPVLPGGASAGLYSLVGEEELIELAWRTLPLVARAVTGGPMGEREVIEIA